MYLNLILFTKKYSNFFSFQIRRSITNVDDFYKPFLTTSETRYNELVMVADFRMVSDEKNLSYIYFITSRKMLKFDLQQTVIKQISYH